MAVELIKTGISGLDQVLKGGLRMNSSILVTGAPGTGKTIMALQFIYHGAKDYNENGIFITTEDNVDSFVESVMIDHPVPIRTGLPSLAVKLLQRAKEKGFSIIF